MQIGYSCWPGAFSEQHLFGPPRSAECLSIWHAGCYDRALPIQQTTATQMKALADVAAREALAEPQVGKLQAAVAVAKQRQRST